MSLSTSWVSVPENSDFSLYNLPFGIFKTDKKGPRVGVAIGNEVLDLSYLEKKGYFKGIDLKDKKVFGRRYLNDFMALGKPVTNRIRERIFELLKSENDELRDHDKHRSRALFKQSEVRMMMPVKVGNYTDFYSSKEHATNVGTMFRDPDNALFPNWKHIPVGYHGRASSIVVSGESVRRPKGQMMPQGAEVPVFGPCRLLDFELEMAFITCKEVELGESVTTHNAEDHIFGFVLFNDWSARDIQKWEYVPLGPFLAKNFASSISPWVVTIEALQQFRVEGPEQDPKVLPYLEFEGKKNFDIDLEVSIMPGNGEEQVVCRSNFKHLYWNVNQQLAHHTVNGCNIQVGDMYASGTISGPTPESYGSMLEIAWQGTKPVKMSDGSERKFIHDGDTVIMRGHAKNNGMRVGFGEVRTKVLPATFYENEDN
ncbi:fumarylacetoacetase [Fulvivirgaceae bacterium BMA10]|uniref:fumarylacetoacetase n=1 Tax=Splendidivirga corallicola TaxID=3051826 RepID=A0ABT8KJJ5_9BACT|nr:fumarylacetoacetase [Fulvivirgaceae bacterium BMA10]